MTQLVLVDKHDKPVQPQGKLRVHELGFYI